MSPLIKQEVFVIMKWIINRKLHVYISMGDLVVAHFGLLLLRKGFIFDCDLFEYFSCT